MQKLDDMSIIATVKAEAEKIDEYMRVDFNRLQPEIDNLLVDVLEYGLLNGGKRIRPLLVVIASRLCGKNDDGAYRLGCAFEYAHTATLFHDDIIDDSKVRRGKKSVYQKFGAVPAVLAGDFLYAQAMATVGKFSNRRGLEIFCKATAGMVDGEFVQLRNVETYNLSEAEYYKALMGKTGLFIAAACEVGALYGGGDEHKVKALRQYGVHLGCAFQLIDDVLDYLGDPEITGKDAGSDLAEGKITLPLILALKDATDKDRARLLQILEDPKQRPHCKLEVTTLIKKYGGFEAVRQKALTAVEEACGVLGAFTDERVFYERNMLEGLARYVYAREK